MGPRHTTCAGIRDFEESTTNPPTTKKYPKHYSKASKYFEYHHTPYNIQSLHTTPQLTHRPNLTSRDQPYHYMSIDGLSMVSDGSSMCNDGLSMDNDDTSIRYLIDRWLTMDNDGTIDSSGTPDRHMPKNTYMGIFKWFSGSLNMPGRLMTCAGLQWLNAGAPA